ncbi:sigma-70 family RNA polymerase sigma factor [Pseudomonas sp. sp1636]|uniref:RNA polymerase sigma factor n=1 Tax=Pseudomonas sp. sp1636 TaxID=3036707 RepID=UPI0025A62183|nr:sigma-70 family RNA polymerase sigma factor [Pseudomonas sp. sp1636]MDM8349483.1 sigma-70 family RNA polymerase sigma factor [Pseudomonas sp. sp1636]
MDEQELIKRLRQGDKGALASVIKLHHAFLVAMATPLVGNDLADDVAQETWLRAFAAIGKFEGRSKLRTWLARIAINEAHAMRRKTGREVSLDGWGSDSGSPIGMRFNEQGAWEAPPMQWHHETPDELLTEAELYECIHKHLHKLPEDQQSVVMMRELGGLNYGEIAQALNLAEGNIRVLLHRGRQRMHAMLNHFEEVGAC